MLDIKLKKRGPSKKDGFRQELRITPAVEKAFNELKALYELKNNSEALDKIANLYFLTK